jgi:hypothetical protein
MHKLFNLKKWLTIGDAARHLTLLFGEAVNEHDVLQLGLDGHLMLSLEFVNTQVARPCAVRATDQDWLSRSGTRSNSVSEAVKAYYSDKVIENPLESMDSGYRVIDIEDQICWLAGHFELPLSFSGYEHVQSEFQRLIGGPEVDRRQGSRIFVGNGHGDLFLLLERFVEDANFDAGLEAREIYRPATQVPPDSMLVVATNSLRGFETDLQRKEAAVALLADSRPTANQEFESDFDPSDLPYELGIGNIAFSAVRNGYGDSSATFKNRLIAYLEKEFQLSPEAVHRIATVANPDKAPGRKRRPPSERIQL